MTEKTLQTAKAFGIDPERLSWTDLARPVYGVFSYWMVVDKDAMAVVEGITLEEHRKIRERIQGTSFWCVPIQPPGVANV